MGQLETKKQKSFYVISSTEGCATNLQENNSYRKDYLAKGYTPSVNPDDADLILINTCAYSQQMEDRSTDMILQFKQKYPNAEVIVAGCLPKINPKKMRNEFQSLSIQSLPESVDFSQSHQFDRQDFEYLSEKHRFVLALRPIYFKIENFLRVKFNPLHNIFKTVVVNEDFHLITVSTGCLGKCTFCAIKRAKGSLKSRPMPTILSEVNFGLEKNKKLFWLLGDDIGCWGIDLKSNIGELLHSILHLPSDFELVLNYFDPHYLQNNTEQLVSLLGNEKVIGLNMPIQSGSQRILQSMSRNYDLKSVFEIIGRIKKQNKRVAIKTNIIVGFPGESWGDFFQSVFSIRHFDAILALKFTPRPNTPAATYEKQVPELTKNIRMGIMNLFILTKHAWVASTSVFRLSRG